MEDVESLQSVYYPPGQSLRLNIADLKAIRDTYHSADQALEEVMLLWLDKKYNMEKFGPPTWRMLVEAVDRKRGGNNHELAKKIASKHPSGSSSLTTYCMTLCCYNNYCMLHVDDSKLSSEDASCVALPPRSDDTHVSKEKPTDSLAGTGEKTNYFS